MSFGIAFSGGGAKGATHIGVLLALEEANLLPTSVAGASAGSIVAGLYSLGYTPTEMKAIVSYLIKHGKKLLDPCYSNIFTAIFQFLTNSSVSISGLIVGDKFEKYLNKITKNTNIEDIKIPLVIPCVDILSGLTVVYTNTIDKPFKKGDEIWKCTGKLSQIMRASSSVPAIFYPKKLDDFRLVDGCLTDALPVEILIESGQKNVLAVDLAEKYKRPRSRNIIEVTLHSFEIMQTSLKKCSLGKEKYLLSPKLPEDVGLLDFSKMNRCMEIGYEETKKALPELKALFN